MLNHILIDWIVNGMLNIKLNIVCLVLLASINISSFAATPSNYDPGDVVMDQDEYFDFRGFENPFDVEENEMDDNKSTDSDSSSDRSLIQSLKDILLGDQHEDEQPINIDLASAPTLLRSAGNQGYKNVVVFHGRFNSYDADLIIPYADYSKLTVVNDYIVNVGNSSSTGKILYDGDVLNPAEYDSYVYIMNPIYGNTSNVYNYGSFNYRRHYYLNTNSGYNRISYDDMYGNFYVDDIDVYYTNSEREYYLLMVIFLFMGVMFLWFRRH